jgi:collagen type III alpha
VLEQTIGKELAAIVKDHVAAQMTLCVSQIENCQSRIAALETRPMLKGDPGERGEKGDPGEAGQRGEKGEQGERGLDGKDGRDGINGTNGLDGKDGKDGAPGRDGLAGLAGRDGKDGAHGKDGAPGKDGKDGADGLGFDHVTFEMADDGCTVIERYARGNLIKEFRRRARGSYRGPWKHDSEYFFDDMVSCGGSGWVAIVPKPKAKPGDGKDWQLFVRKGRDGKDGERGPAGPQGPPGQNASF